MRERVPTNRKIDKSSRTFVFFLRKIFKIFIYRYFKSEKSVWINSSNSFFLTASTFYKPSIFVIFSIILVPSGVFVGIKIRIYIAIGPHPTMLWKENPIIIRSVTCWINPTEFSVKTHTQRLCQ